MHFNSFWLHFSGSWERVWDAQGRFLGSPKGPIKDFHENLDFPSIWGGFGRVFGGLWEGFGRVLGGYWDGLVGRFRNNFFVAL